MIKVQKANGDIINIDSKYTLQKGDTVYIDGKLVQAENIEVGDNQIIITINGKIVIIDNTYIFSENVQNIENLDELSNADEGYTSIVFNEDPSTDQDNIIDSLNDMLDIVNTQAGEKAVQSHSFSTQFDEISNEEVNVEATLRDANFRSDTVRAQELLKKVENEALIDSTGYNDARKKEGVSENGGIPEDYNDESKFVNNKEEDTNTNNSNNYAYDSEEETQETDDSDNTDKDNTEETQETDSNDSSINNINEENTNNTKDTTNGGEDVIDNNIEDSPQDVVKTQEQKNEDENNRNNADEQTKQTDEPLQTDETVQNSNEQEEKSEESNPSSKTNEQKDQEDLADDTEPTDDSSTTDSTDILDNQDGTRSGQDRENNQDLAIKTPTNEVPVIDEENILTVEEDNSINFTKNNLLANVTDPNENDILDIANVTSNIGTVQETENRYTISDIPENYNGTIELSMTATDGNIETSGKALITVTPVNDSPKVQFINPTILEDNPVEIEIITSDIENNNVTVTVFQGPDNGTATMEDGVLTYTPVENYNGTQEITLKTTDGENIKYSTMEIMVTPVNDEPEINIVKTLEVQEDSSGIITFDISDIDGDNTSFSLQEPEHGTIIVDGTTVNYFPDENYSGVDNITVNYTDGIAEKSSTVNIEVKEVNDSPYIEVVNEVRTVEDQVQEILMDAGDIEGTVDITVEADNGVAIVDEDGNIVYSPNANYNGTDTIVISAKDENGVITNKNVNVQIDNDNSDIAYEIKTETITENHIETV